MFVTLAPRVQWCRRGTRGHVEVSFDVPAEDSVISGGRILVAQPAGSRFGGEAEREMLTHKVRAARDLAKSVLRELGYKGVK